MKSFLIVLFFITFFSCSEKKTSSIDPLDYISDTTAIPIDRNTEPYTRTMQFVNGNLYWWNSNRETISVINLSSKKVEKTIRLERDGPNGLGNPLGIFVLDPDSIYVPTMAYELSLVNGNGNSLVDYDYHNFSKLGVVVASMTRYSNMIQTNHSDIFYLAMRDLKNLPYSNLNDQALLEYPPILSFNRNKGSFEFLDFKVPSSLLNFDDIIDFGITGTSNSLLLLHYQSNTLLEVDFNGVNFKEHLLQSDLMKNFSNAYYHSDRMSNSVEDNMRTSYKSSENFGLSFDPNKNLLYRFGWPGEEIPEEADPMDFSSTPPFFVIGIYNGTDFSLIKEFTLPRNTYLAHHYFVDEKGLNLFPMHPDNPEFNEDEMVIHTFDFSGLK